MTKRTLVQIRTNSNLSVNYKDLTLSPEVELIMLFAEPKYELTKKSEIVKGHELNEFRIKNKRHKSHDRRIAGLTSATANV